MKKDSKQNNFNGKVNFHGPAQVAGGDIINFLNEEKKHTAAAGYTSEPVWRSPFTLAVLSWISVILTVVSVIPFGKILQILFFLFQGNIRAVTNFTMNYYVYSMAISLLLLVFSLWLRSITKKQIRIPLAFDYAINGMDHRIVIEKVKPGKCPICGGKMKYYNKPVEWREHYVDGKTKREVVKRTPALECRRNCEHWFKVDQAEEKIS